MNWRGVFTLSAITALGFALVPAKGGAQQKTPKEQLVETWTLVSHEIKQAATGQSGAAVDGRLGPT
jgi:hypothetical protein